LERVEDYEFEKQKEPLLSKTASTMPIKDFEYLSIASENVLPTLRPDLPLNLPDLKPSSISDYCKNNSIDTPYNSSLIINTQEFNEVVEKLRSFFISKKFLEVSTQNRLSILAACEDPFNVGTFNYAGNCWPLPQTGQMWLEYELLKNPEPAGYFCLTTSYRMEKNPVENRHDLIFPLFEFEMKGGMDKLVELEKDLLIHLGYDSEMFIEEKYENIGKLYGVKELVHEHEQKLYEQLTPTFFIKDFPEFTSPFWNMMRDDKNDTAKKVDVIMSGQETIGSAERETSKEVMRERFESIMDGVYKDKIYELFGKERTDKELDDYLDFDFFERCGGGIGMTRLIRSMKMEGLLKCNSSNQVDSMV
jgi:aspartyl/asparaginyl-tRNA synthetase